MAIKTLFFDFGGCIDAPGIHTRTLFWRAFLQAGAVIPEQQIQFQEAYSQADRRMMATGEAKAMALAPFNRFNAQIIAETLGLKAGAGDRPADMVSDEMAGHIARARVSLERYAKELPLGIISNFTGNLEVILREFSLRSLFGSVTESFYEGCSKPDLRIFRAALAKQPFAPEECLYVGDNPVNDIEPARVLGIKSALIYVEGSRRECGADAYIKDLAELAPVLKTL